MPFGSLLRNANNVKVIGEDTESVVLHPNETGAMTSLQLPIANAQTQYAMQRKPGMIPIFQITPSLTRISAIDQVNIGDGICMPSTMELVYSTVPSTSIPLRYLCSSKQAPKGSGGYGMRIYDAAGAVMWDSSQLLANVTRRGVPKLGDTVTLTNGRWFAPVLWYDDYAEDRDGYATRWVKAQLVRQGTTQNWSVSSYRFPSNAPLPSGEVLHFLEIAIS